MWSKTKEAQDKLPLLIRRTIINNIGFNNIVEIDIPGGDSNWKPGYDGVIEAKIGSILGDAGVYVIECGQSEKIEDKFKSDLKKRTKELNGQKTDRTFIFITTHKLKDKNGIIKKLKNSNHEYSLWKDIKIFDADDIETWLDFDPAATSWLAYILGKPRNNVRSFEEVWDNFSASTQIPLDADVILAREHIDPKKIEEIKSWLQNSDNKIWQIKSDSREESLLFFMALVENSGHSIDVIEAIKSRIVIIYEIGQWQRIVETKTAKNFIIISMFSIPENLAFLKNQGFKIVITIGNSDLTNNKDVIDIKFLNKAKLSNVLWQKEKNKRWDDFLRQFPNRLSLLSLQRALARDDAPLKLPKWAEDNSKYEILLLCALIGKWDENNHRDRELISRVFESDYGKITKILWAYTKMEEAPIIKNISVWEVISVNTIFDYLGDRITNGTFLKYLETIRSILNDEDQNTCSNELIDGVARGLSIINSKNIFDKTLRANEQVTKLAQDTYDSIYDDFLVGGNSQQILRKATHLFAEAAPEYTLDFMEDLLKKSPQVFIENTSQMLEIAEVLAWADSYFFKRVVNILIKLYQKLSFSSENDNCKSQLLKLLAQIFSPWTNYTSVQLARKKKILCRIADGNDKGLIYELFLGIANLRSSINNRLPNSQVDLKEQRYANDIEIFEFHKFLINKLLDMLSPKNTEYWEKVTNSIAITCLLPNKDREELFKRLLDKMDQVEWANVNKDFKQSIFQIIYKGLENKNTLWDKNNEQAHDLLHEISAGDPMYEGIQKFCSSSYFHDKPIPELQKTIQAIFGGSMDNLTAFAKRLSCPYIFAHQLGYFQLETDQIKYLLNAGEGSAEIYEFTKCFFCAVMKVHGIGVLDKIFNFQWDIEYQKLLITQINITKSFLDWLTKNELLELYIRSRDNFITDKDSYESVILKLNDLGNYPAMISLIYCQIFIEKLGHMVRNEHIICALKGLDVTESVKNNNKFCIKELFKVLRVRKNIDAQDMSQLELKYFDILFCENDVALKPVEVHKQFRENPEVFVNLFNANMANKNRNSPIFRFVDLIRNNLCIKAVFPFETKEQLQRWVEEILYNLKDKNSKTIEGCLNTIGTIFAYAPVDSDDNIWPIKYVRDTIEYLYDNDVFDRKNRAHFESGVINRKMMVCEADPSRNWVNLAEKIEKDISSICDKYPATACVLKKLADCYIGVSVWAEYDYD